MSTAALRELHEAARGNRLLAALPKAEWERLLPQLELHEPTLKEVCHAAEQPIGQVWFPLGGMTSMTATLQDGGVVEVGTIGREGFVGLPVFLGADTAAQTTLTQVQGPVLQMSADAFRAEMARGGTLVRILHRYTQAFFAQLAQSIACNRLHSLSERFARWMLMSADRAGDEFLMTHEFMAQMLGVRRAGVTEALQELQRAGAVSYERGRMRVLDRARLEDVSCECYAIVRAEYDRMIDGLGEPAR